MRNKRFERRYARRISAAWRAALGFEAVETNNDFEDVSNA